MNSYQLIYRLRVARAERYLTSADQALYHELVAVCNEQKWKEVFYKKNAELCAALNMSEKTLIKARATLAQAGLIRFRSSRDKRIGCYYSFSNAELSSPCSTDDPVTTPAVTAVTSSVECPDDPPAPPIKENIKTLNPKTCAHVRKAPPSPALVFPFASDRFRSVWDSLCRCPKWKGKQNYALQLSLNKLGRFAEEFAIEQMERAIESNWTGVVFPGTEEKYQEWLNRKNGKSTYSPGAGGSGSQPAAQRKESVSQLTDLAGSVLRAIAAEKFG